MVNAIKKEQMKQLVRFGLVGASGVGVNLAVFSAALGLGAGYQAAAVAAFLVAVSHNFYWNARWTFRLLAQTNKKMFTRYLWFVGISAVCLLLNLSALSVLIDNWRLPPVAAQVGAVLTVGVVNFWLQARMTFRGIGPALVEREKAVNNG